MTKKFLKICLLADASSVHVQKWATFFSQKGYDVHIISFIDAHIPNVKVHHIQLLWPNVINHSASTISILRKTTYLLYLGKIKKLIHHLQPDILHAHYATSYGFCGVVANYHPFVISVWGSDVIDFPNKSWIRKQGLKYILNKADYITATSQMLTAAVKQLTGERLNIGTIPFGVNVEKFIPDKKKSDNVITIGIVKGLEEKYGHPLLIKAFKRCTEKFNNIRLLVVGSGIMDVPLKKLCEELHLTDKVIFSGHVANDNVPGYLNQMDVFVMPSIMESETFGVAVVEASACGIPVIASNIGGLPEVVCHGETGYLFPSGDVDQLSDYMGKLIRDTESRNRMGLAGREYVLQNYDWQKNAMQMQQLYDRIVTEY